MAFTIDEEALGPLPEKKKVSALGSELTIPNLIMSIATIKTRQKASDDKIEKERLDKIGRKQTAMLEFKQQEIEQIQKLKNSGMTPDQIGQVLAPIRQAAVTTLFGSASDTKTTAEAIAEYSKLFNPTPLSQNYAAKAKESEASAAFLRSVTGPVGSESPAPSAAPQGLSPTTASASAAPRVQALQAAAPSAQAQSAQAQPEPSSAAPASPIQQPSFRPKTISAGGMTFERTPTQQDYDEIARETEVRKRASLETEIKVAKEQLSKELDTFFALDSQIKRGSGFKGRLKAGAKTLISGYDQGDFSGSVAATHAGAVKRLRTYIARANGDRGNISIIEQKAAEKLIPSIWDAPETAALKRAYLKSYVQAIGSSKVDENLVKTRILNFLNDERLNAPREFQTEEDARKAAYINEILPGQRIVVNGTIGYWKEEDIDIPVTEVRR